MLGQDAVRICKALEQNEMVADVTCFASCTLLVHKGFCNDLRHKTKDSHGQLTRIFVEEKFKKTDNQGGED